jgi:hypothetical protein
MSEPKFTVVEGLRPSGAEASIWYDDGDLAAEVYGNLGTLPEPIDALWLAKLFAASFEMYEALKDADRQLVQMYRAINPAANEGEGNRMADNDWSVKSVRAALSKARGETE